MSVRTNDGVSHNFCPDCLFNALTNPRTGERKITQTKIEQLEWLGKIRFAAMTEKDVEMLAALRAIILRSEKADALADAVERLAINGMAGYLDVKAALAAAAAFEALGNALEKAYEPLLRFDDDGPPWPRTPVLGKPLAKTPPGFLRGRNLTGPGKGRRR
jgi:hypothetical protein